MEIIRNMVLLVLWILITITIVQISVLSQNKPKAAIMNFDGN